MQVEAVEPKTVTILYTNDVHGAIDGYADFAGYKQQISEDHTVIAVDAGDSIQGEVIDQLTDGEASVELMNASGYDYAVPGNHEFDYQVPQFLSLVEEAEYQYLSCNFTKADGTAVDGISAYAIKDLGDYQIGFVGVTTPETYTKSTPTYFMDENGNYIYSFHENDLYDQVQSAVNAVRNAGADYVIAIGHTGMAGTDERWNTQTIIANTTGIDAWIDGHSHEEIPGPDYQGTTFTNKNGNSVIETSTGTKFKYIGRMDLTIDASGRVSATTRLVPMAEAQSAVTSDTAVAKRTSVQSIIDADNAEVAKMLTKVATAEQPLYINDPTTTERMVRSRECNAGDFVADAYRTVLNADIGLSNGGGVRTNISAGDVTVLDLNNLNPFGNELCVIRASGQQILDALEHAVRNLPDENGGFLQVSGLTYDIDESVASPVVTDDKGSFLEIPAGSARRVRNVRVNGAAIDPNGTYTIAASKYMLVQYGDGMTMWEGAELVTDNGLKDHDALIQYARDYLGGVISAQQYGNPYGSGRIYKVRGTTSVSGTITWTGSGTKTDQVIHLYRNGVEVASQTVKAGATSYSFDDLALYDVTDGSETAFVYTVSLGETADPSAAVADFNLTINTDLPTASSRVSVKTGVEDTAAEMGLILIGAVVVFTALKRREA
jgi:2',3'-cyclic-nucleotide 2'-phosphodiesterase (5'-nucleotidase family)